MTKMKSFLALFYFICSVLTVVHIAWTQDVPSVSIAQGEVVGAHAADGDYSVFYGIPYAGPVSGRNRFKAPPPPPNFTGTFSATDSSTECVQPSDSGIRGVEDCLVLDIHTKTTNSSSPVMVWLYGGHYTTGSKRGVTFQNLVEEELVVVALNYRLSIFGFLCLRVPDAPGNAGMKDVVAGLKWVKENIAAFGGNPNDITLFGQGSGAAMADLISLQSVADGFVTKVIAQSGSSLSPWAVAYQPLQRARKFGENIGFVNHTDEELATAFMNTNLEILLTSLNNYKFTDNSALFAPCLEDPAVDVNDIFMTKAPLTILRSGNYIKVPFVTGYTSAEGSLRAAEVMNDGWLNKMETNFIEFLQPDLGFDNETVKAEVGRSIKNYYFPLGAIDNTSIPGYLKYHGDVMILVSVIRGVRERVVNSPSLVRLYQFDFKGTYGEQWPYTEVPLDGARHGRELDYLFARAEQNGSFADAELTKSITRRWAALAYTGIPIAAAEPGNVWWFPVLISGINCFVYTEPRGTPGLVGITEMSTLNPHQVTMNFWLDLYTNYYKSPQEVEDSQAVEDESQEIEEDSHEIEGENRAPSLCSYAITISLCQIIIKCSI